MKIGIVAEYSPNVEERTQALNSSVWKLKGGSDFWVGNVNRDLEKGERMRLEDVKP